MEVSFVALFVVLFLASALVSEFSPRFFPRLLEPVARRLEPVARRLLRWVSSRFAFVQRDPLAVLGVGSAVVAFLFWAIPGTYCSDSQNSFSCSSLWFSSERLPASAAFVALSFILLLLRRR